MKWNFDNLMNLINNIKNILQIIFLYNYKIYENETWNQYKKF